jgi:hypothetical protein
MESEDYAALRDLSSRVFKNALVVPVAWAVPRVTDVGGSFVASQVREELSGKLESNQIREALGRIEEIGAVTELPYPGRPHARTWERVKSPFWQFLEKWMREQTGLRSPRPSKG